MPNWYNDYDDRDTPDDNDVALIAERERREIKPHITALPSHCNPGRYYMPYDMDGSFFLDIDEMNEEEFEAYYRTQQIRKQTKQQAFPSTYCSSRPVDVPITPVDLPPPTCNCCDTPMTPRMGRFGKFYFCNNGCESQPTISDKAWKLHNETV